MLKRSFPTRRGFVKSNLPWSSSTRAESVNSPVTSNKIFDFAIQFGVRGLAAVMIEREKAAIMMIALTDCMMKDLMIFLLVWFVVLGD